MRGRTNLPYPTLPYPTLPYLSTLPTYPTYLHTYTHAKGMEERVVAFTWVGVLSNIARPCGSDFWWHCKDCLSFANLGCISKVVWVLGRLVSLTLRCFAHHIIALRVCCCLVKA